VRYDPCLEGLIYEHSFDQQVHGSFVDCSIFAISSLGTFFVSWESGSKFGFAGA